MRKYLFLLVALLASCNIALAATPGVAVLKADIHCDNCKSKILQNVKALGEGVKDVKVDVASQIVFVEFDADKNSEANIIKGLSAIGVKAERAKAEKMELKGKPNGKPFCKMPPPGQQAKVKKCDAVESTKCDKKAVDCDKKQACGKAKADCGLKPTCDKKVADCEKKPACDKAKADCCDKAVAKVESKCCGKAGCCDSKCKQEGNKCCGKADCCPDMKCNK